MPTPKPERDTRPTFFLLISEDLNQVFFDSRDWPGKTVDQIFKENHPDSSGVWVIELSEDDVGYSVYSTVDTLFPIDYDSRSQELVESIRKDFQFVGYLT